MLQKLVIITKYLNGDSLVNELRHIIFWSAITTVPLFYIGIFGVVTSTANERHMGHLEFLLVATIIFGAMGCLGLMISAFPATYEFPKLRRCARGGIISGYGPPIQTFGLPIMLILQIQIGQ